MNILYTILGLCSLGLCVALGVVLYGKRERFKLQDLMSDKDKR